MDKEIIRKGIEAQNFGLIAKIEKLGNSYAISYQYEKRQFKVLDFTKENLESKIDCIDRLTSQPFLNKIDNSELTRLKHNLDFLKKSINKKI